MFFFSFILTAFISFLHFFSESILLQFTVTNFPLHESEIAFNAAAADDTYAETPLAIYQQQRFTGNFPWYPWCILEIRMCAFNTSIHVILFPNNLPGTCISLGYHFYLYMNTSTCIDLFLEVKPLC